MFSANNIEFLRAELEAVRNAKKMVDARLSDIKSEEAQLQVEKSLLEKTEKKLTADVLTQLETQSRLDEFQKRVALMDASTVLGEMTHQRNNLLQANGSLAQIESRLVALRGKPVALTDHQQGALRSYLQQHDNAITFLNETRSFISLLEQKQQSLKAAKEAAGAGNYNPTMYSPVVESIDGRYVMSGPRGRECVIGTLGRK